MVRNDPRATGTDARPTPRGIVEGGTGADQAATGTSQGHPARQRHGAGDHRAVLEIATLHLLSAAQDSRGRTRHQPWRPLAQVAHFDSLVLTPTNRASTSWFLGLGLGGC